MRKILILLMFILSLMGYNSDFFREFQQKLHFFSSTIEDDDNTDFSVNNLPLFFFEDFHLLPITFEKPSSSLRLHTTFRVLIITTSFKEICFKQFFKNRLLTSNIITNICLVKRLHAGYYTYGQGKIRV